MSVYKMIGADGRQYGPVTADQVRDWIAQGRANAHSRVLAEGATEWKTLSELPEFAAALGATPARPTASRVLPVTGGQAEAEAIAQEILTRDYHLKIGSCISRGWNLVLSRFWLTVGATFVVALLSTAVGLLQIPALLLNLVLWTGLNWMFLKLVRGQKAEFSDAFAGFSPAFVPLMLFSLVAQVLTLLGIALCVLPGVYLAIAWTMFAGLLIMDKGLEFWPAMELSRKVVTRHWWVVFGLALVCVLLMFVGSLVCIIGFFVAMPIAVAAVVYAYEDIFGSQPRLPTQALAPAPMPVGPAPSPLAPPPATVPASTPTEEPASANAPSTGTQPQSAAPTTPDTGTSMTIPPAPSATQPENPPGSETSSSPGSPPPAGV